MQRNKLFGQKNGHPDGHPDGHYVSEDGYDEHSGSDTDGHADDSSAQSLLSDRETAAAFPDVLAFRTSGMPAVDASSSGARGSPARVAGQKRGPPAPHQLDHCEEESVDGASTSSTMSLVGTLMLAAEAGRDSREGSVSVLSDTPHHGQGERVPSVTGITASGPLLGPGAEPDAAGYGQPATKRLRTTSEDTGFDGDWDTSSVMSTDGPAAAHTTAAATGTGTSAPVRAAPGYTYAIPPALAQLLDNGITIQARSSSGKPLKGAAKAKAQAKTHLALQAAAEQGILRVGLPGTGCLIWRDATTGQLVLDTVALGLAQGVYLEQCTIQALAAAAAGQPVLLPAAPASADREAGSSGNTQEESGTGKQSGFGTSLSIAEAMDVCGFTLCSPLRRYAVSRDSSGSDSDDSAASNEGPAAPHTWVSYTTAHCMADAGPHYTQWTSYRLKTHVLEVEGPAGETGSPLRYALQRDAELSADGYDTYTWYRRGEDGCLESLQSACDWADFRWQDGCMCLRGRVYQIAAFRWLLQPEDAQEQAASQTSAGALQCCV